jgi:hypothetical protein
VERTTAEGACCALCNGTIDAEYHRVNGQPVCSGCLPQFRHLQSQGIGLGFGRAALAGAGAALAGAVVWRIVTALTGYELGILAAAIGWAVGRTVRWGSGGMGGRRFQILAVALTYFGITASYVPLILSEVMKRPAVDRGAFEVTVMLLVVVAFSMAAPFLAGIRNVLGLIIIGIGLWEAWRINRRVEIAISGPHQAGGQREVT